MSPRKDKKLSTRRELGRSVRAGIVFEPDTRRVPGTAERALREEFQALREEIARREATQKPENQPPDTNQGEEPLQKASVHEPNQGNNANIIFLDTKKREDPHEIKVLKDKIIRLETGLDKDIERIGPGSSLDRQRIAKLEQKEPQPLQKDRGEILIALIATNGGKMLAKYARLKMHLDKATFSRLLNTLSDKITRKIHQLDHRKRLLVLDSS